MKISFPGMLHRSPTHVVNQAAVAAHAQPETVDATNNRPLFVPGRNRPASMSRPGLFSSRSKGFPKALQNLLNEKNGTLSETDRSRRNDALLKHFKMPVPRHFPPTDGETASALMNLAVTSVDPNTVLLALAAVEAVMHAPIGVAPRISRTESIALFECLSGHYPRLPGDLAKLKAERVLLGMRVSAWDKRDIESRLRSNVMQQKTPFLLEQEYRDALHQMRQRGDSFGSGRLAECILAKKIAYDASAIASLSPRDQTAMLTGFIAAIGESERRRLVEVAEHTGSTQAGLSRHIFPSAPDNDATVLTELDRLGRGKHGVVYLDRSQDQHFAVKVAVSQDEIPLRDRKRELDFLTSVPPNKHIVGFHGLCSMPLERKNADSSVETTVVDGFRTEYVNGITGSEFDRSLDVLVDNGKMNEEQRSQIHAYLFASKLDAALHAAKHGFIMCDVSNDNEMVDKTGTLKLPDFGKTAAIDTLLQEIEDPNDHVICALARELWTSADKIYPSDPEGPARRLRSSAQSLSATVVRAAQPAADSRSTISRLQLLASSISHVGRSKDGDTTQEVQKGTGNLTELFHLLSKRFDVDFSAPRTAEAMEPVPARAP